MKSSTTYADNYASYMAAVSDAASRMTSIMANWLGFTTRRLPDDVLARLTEMRDAETDPAAIALYETMFRNLDLAWEMKRPSCQDTGIPQFWIKCGSSFPLIGKLEELLVEAVRIATRETPLRPNSVETFDEYNTGSNIGTGTPVFWWDIVPDWDGCEIYTYLSGGGCALPGQAMVLMPSQGYGEIVRMVMDRMTSFGLNACPPLLVGVGVGMSIETAALNSKKALMRPVGSVSENEGAARLEKLLFDGINAIGIGPQGLGGSESILGVNVVNTARHPASLGAAVSVGCWCHRRGHIVFDRDLNYTVTSHTGFEPSRR